MPRKKSVDSASEPELQKPKKRAVRKKKADPKAVEEEIVSIPPEETEAAHESLPGMPSASDLPAQPQQPAEEVDHFEIHPDALAAIHSAASAVDQKTESAPAPEPLPDPTPEVHPMADTPAIAHEEEHHTEPEGELLESSHAEKTDSKPQASMADIKPKQNGDFPTFAELNGDRDFLAPEKFSFDLKPGAKQPEQKAKASWLRTLIYILVGIAVLSAGALIFLNYYSQKLLNQNQNAVLPSSQNQQSGTDQNSAQTTPTSAVPSLALVNANQTVTGIITSAAGSNANLLKLDTATQVTLPAAGADVLYIKSTNADQAKKISDFLNNLGINPQIQQKSDLPVDYALYLTSALSNINLGGMTAAVYNSGSVTGLASKYCSALNKYKITSCNALNATTKQNTFTVSSNKQAAIVILSRTPEFKNATFGSAASGQVEDIRVTASK